MSNPDTDTHAPSSIVIAVDAEINVLERSVDQDHPVLDEFAAAAESNRFDDELIERIRELSHTAVGWTAAEFRYQLRKRHGIEASLVEVHRALNGALA